MAWGLKRASGDPKTTRPLFNHKAFDLNSQESAIYSGKFIVFAGFFLLTPVFHCGSWRSFPGKMKIDMLWTALLVSKWLS